MPDAVRAPEIALGDETLDVSLVIPTFNREGLLRRSLPDLANQEAGNYTYEVIFVINGSTDGSKQVLEEAAARWPGKIRHLYNPPSGGPAAPRNIGIRAARGRVVIIIDDDVIPDRRLVFHHAEFHRRNPDPEFAAVGELTIPEEVLDDPMSLFHEMISYENLRNRERLSYLDFWTCNVSVKRSFMMQHGMFDETIPYFEDVLCGYQLAGRGMQLCFVPEAKGLHLHQMRLTDVAAKGTLIGKCLYEFEQRVPHTEVRQRFGILSRDLGPKAYVIRLMNRVFLYTLSNPLIMAGLRALATASRKRSRLTDLYYYLLFRRHNLSGYNAAKRALGRNSGAATFA
jgi:glycosyltransferase involved in cell wall biosynthesis